MPLNTGSQQVDLQTLVAAIQNAVQAQNLIATRIAAVTTALQTAFPVPILGSASWTPGGIASGASAAISFPVTGAALGNFVKCGLAEDLKACVMTAYVPVANKVEVVIGNMTGSTVTFAVTTVNVSVAGA